MTDMLKSLLSKKSQDGTFLVTHDILTNSGIARFSFMHNIIKTYTLPHTFVYASKKTLYQYVKPRLIY